MRLSLVLLCLLASSFVTRPERSESRTSAVAGPDRPAYRLYDTKLKSTTYAKLLRQAADADVVLFGELHNNPICHWFELQQIGRASCRERVCSTV